MMQSACSLFLFLFCSFRVLSQTTTPVHNTIDGLHVSYKVATTANQPAQGGNGPNLQARPYVDIVLKTTDGVSKIYLKIIRMQDNSQVYQVRYDLNSPAINNAQGQILFYKDGNTLHICDPDVISLAPYRYEAYTQDAQGHSSDIFSAIQ
jgi:hypothetical protein